MLEIQVVKCKIRQMWSVELSQIQLLIRFARQEDQLETSPDAHTSEIVAAFLTDCAQE